MPCAVCAAEPVTPAAELGTRDAVILGLVEGITEFLPISSTGHLIIATHLLGLESEVPLTDAEGRPLWYKQPTPQDPAGIPLTPKLAADTYIVVIQIGAILAVVLLYWGQLASMLRGVLGRDNAGLRLLRNIFCAFLPVALVGLLASKWIERHLFSIGTVIIGLIGGAILMLVAERRHRLRAGVGREIRDPADLYATQALGIGLMQCLALWPGTSRSMVTIVGGYFAGLTPAKSAEFSFLVGLPVLAGAAVIKGARSGAAMIEVFGWPNVLLGIAVAAVSAAVAVKFLVAFLNRQGLEAFAVYRLILAALLAAVFYL
jgi:undecaprenyl-diphosphatase